MANEIISYIEMCRRESSSFQRGMNFELGRGYSVILMSVRRNAPYQDRVEDEGTTLIYEGHDASKTKFLTDPKSIDQPDRNFNGSLTQNGRFWEASVAYKDGKANPSLVRVYEKIMQGIWSYNGLFELVDAWREKDDRRTIFKFKLIAVAEERSTESSREINPHRRIIPSLIKMEVWKRDGGKCVVCGAKDELHFDHDLPYSKGGTSLRTENVQLLCARHNLAKSDKIL